jgi:hypothetical protein
MKIKRFMDVSRTGNKKEAEKIRRGNNELAAFF